MYIRKGTDGDFMANRITLEISIEFILMDYELTSM